MYDAWGEQTLSVAVSLSNAMHTVTGSTYRMDLCIAATLLTVDLPYDSRIQDGYTQM